MRVRVKVKVRVRVRVRVREHGESMVSSPKLFCTGVPLISSRCAAWLGLGSG